MGNLQWQSILRGENDKNKNNNEGYRSCCLEGKRKIQYNNFRLQAGKVCVRVCVNVCAVGEREELVKLCGERLCFLSFFLGFRISSVLGMLILLTLLLVTTNHIISHIIIIKLVMTNIDEHHTNCCCC